MVKTEKYKKFVQIFLHYVQVFGRLCEAGKGELMKKKDILDLIKYHCEDDDVRFKEIAYAIASDFDEAGDSRLAECILGYISETNTFSIQSLEEDPMFYTLLPPSYVSPVFPSAIQADLNGIYNAIERGTDVSKFLLYGPPGTGKTEFVRFFGSLLKREIVFIEFDTIINSKLGETTRNIRGLFDEIRTIKNPQDYLFLFDEIDALALDRVNSHDLREMGRATSAFLKEMDRTDERYLIFATTNLFKHFDTAILRRFDACIDFGRYEQTDLQKISEELLANLAFQYNFIGKDQRLFKKIIAMSDSLPLPGDLKNLLKKSIVFSDNTDEFDYLKRLYIELTNADSIDPIKLKAQGFTLREMEHLTNIPKSTLANIVKAN